MAPQPAFEFQWHSSVGIATGLFLSYGVFSLVVSGILTPLLARRMQRRILLIGPRSDTILFGRTPAELLDACPEVGLVQHTLFMLPAGALMSFGILQLALTWYGLKNGEPWAFWALVIGDLSILPFLAFYLRPFLQRGAPVFPRGLAAPPIFYFPFVIIPIAAVLGWLGLR